MGFISIPANATTAQIQKIIEKGGDFRFTKGIKYKITSTLYLTTNTELDLNGATLRRYCDGPLLRLKDSANCTAYNGTHDIIIENGTLEGMSGPGYPFASNSLLTMFHAHDIIIRNVTFLDLPGGHGVDCCACKNVKVLNCAFKGFNNFNNSPYRESFQVDWAFYGGLPTYKKGSKCYDETHCKNITIDGCLFDKSNDFPASYGAIGAHVCSDNNDKWHENIVIKNCIGHGNGSCSGWDVGFVNVIHFKNVTIENNIIDGYGRLVVCKKLSKIYNKDFESVKDAKYQQNVDTMIISNNTIKNHNKSTVAKWGVYAPNQSGNKHIQINGNTGITKSCCDVKGTDINLFFK